ALDDDLFAGIPGIEEDILSLEVEEDAKCSLFGIRKVEGIDPAAESPLWLQRELMLCGQRPVNAATDVTNYVMMLLGQPMHAFDAGKITGNLRVHRASEGDTLTTLDGVERTLSSEDVVISDDSGIQSLAGVMGGSTSEISDETVDVLFEARTGTRSPCPAPAAATSSPLRPPAASSVAPTPRSSAMRWTSRSRCWSASPVARSCTAARWSARCRACRRSKCTPTARARSRA